MFFFCKQLLSAHARKHELERKQKTDTYWHKFSFTKKELIQSCQGTTFVLWTFKKKNVTHGHLFVFILDVISLVVDPFLVSCIIVQGNPITV